jgi:ABC-type dipeptide/oligopeptide/nickel transport system permease component
MDNQQIAEYFKEHWLLILSLNFGLGLIFGSIPLLLGIRRGKRTLGIIALVVTAVVSVPSFLLGVLSSAIFTVVVLMKGKINSNTDLA